jgi:hypothetical protein
MDGLLDMVTRGPLQELPIMAMISLLSSGQYSNKRREGGFHPSMTILTLAHSISWFLIA